jgi:hypothetical protein
MPQKLSITINIHFTHRSRHLKKFDRRGDYVCLPQFYSAYFDYSLASPVIAILAITIDISRAL